MTGAGGDAGLILGVNLQGFGQRPAAWRTQDVDATDLLTAEFWADLGRTAERGLLDMVFFADHPAFGDPNVRAYGLLEPFVALGAIADATSHLGLVGTASTTYNDPFDVAERLLSLDTVSGGRVAWNAVTTYDRSVSANFGVATNPDRPERYARAGSSWTS
ncbi:LLM class flavin-dependent oxidoreductase [Curtobacterium sp. 24E2]|nr:LLM class flavin-dependent oxidoreductase [Curtobacterium sp. 24E2]